MQKTIAFLNRNYLNFRKIFLFQLIFTISFSVFAQLSADSQVRDEIKFGEYLIKKGNNTDAIYLLEKIDTSHISIALRDSLYYVIGWASYKNKKLEKTIHYFSEISNGFPLKDKTTFFLAYSYSFLGFYDKSIQILNRYNTDNLGYQKLKNFQLSGNAILMRNRKDFDLYANRFGFNHFAIAKQEENLKGISLEMTKFKPKSLFLAGFLSSIVPGLGKIYIGDKGAGIAAFFTVGALMGITAENYAKNGINDYRTILSGSLTSLFYLGNIYGSISALKVKREKYYARIDHQVLFELHIPLRTIFN